MKCEAEALMNVRAEPLPKYKRICGNGIANTGKEA